MISIEREHLGLMMEAGYVYLGMQRFKEARDVFEGVTSLAPESEIPLVALGSVDFCQGKFTNAIRRYKKALKINPQSTYALAYMGEALFFMGKKAEAVKQLNEVNKLEPAGKASDFAKALLDAISKGFTPQTLSGVDEIKAYLKKKEAKG
ncbi:MAG: tetratricopeptide repeat protein [Deltaproteobacteria bacterium]|nr:tetratricopeptide repeat protein [Deltaproteobacteria bacterium]